MVTLWILLLVCVVGRLEISNGNPISDANDVVYDSANLGGKTIFDMGTKFDNPLMRLIGKTLINMKEETTSENKQIAEELCHLHPCTEWSAWTDCPAIKRGDYSMVSRDRTCGYTSALCASAGGSKTETETKVCEGNVCLKEYNYTQHGFCLKYFNINVNKTDAESTCQKDGGHVVNINSKIKSDDVHAILQNYNMGDTWLWMDGYRKDVNAPWEYTYGSASVNFSNWAPGQPNKNGPELCISEYIHAGVRHWWDVGGTPLHRVICELPR